MGYQQLSQRKMSGGGDEDVNKVKEDLAPQTR